MNRESEESVLNQFNAKTQGQGIYAINLPAKSSSTRKAMDFVERMCRQYRVSEDIIGDIVLVTDEACTNIIKYAYKKQNRREAWMSVGVSFDGDGNFHLILKDEGNIFKAEKVEKPDIFESLKGASTGGYGMYIIQSLMDRVDYYRDGSRNVFVARKSILAPSRKLSPTP